MTALHAVASEPRCRACGCRLTDGVGDDLTKLLCRDHKNDPRSRVPKAPRAFTQAEKSMIARLHQHMPTAQLLDILNARLAIDAGAAAVPFTVAQLQAEVDAIAATAASDGDWASLRKLLATARRSGLLRSITAQVIDDFAVIWKLSPAQHMHVRDVIRNAQEDRS